jgi:hypothetical protein
VHSKLCYLSRMDLFQNSNDSSLGIFALLLCLLVPGVGILTLWQAWWTYQRPNRARSIGKAILLGLNALLGVVAGYMGSIMHYTSVNPFFDLYMAVSLSLGALSFASQATGARTRLVAASAAQVAASSVLCTGILLLWPGTLFYFHALAYVPLVLGHLSAWWLLLRLARRYPTLAASLRQHKWRLLAYAGLTAAAWVAGGHVARVGLAAYWHVVGTRYGFDLPVDHLSWTILPQAVVAALATLLAGLLVLSRRPTIAAREA